MSQFILYHYWRSSCSWRVRWAMALKGLEFQSEAVNLLNAEHASPEYKLLNPMGYVPALRFGGQVFGESLAIIEWLEETHPAPPLFPEDPLLRMRTRQLAYTIASGTQPLQNLSTQRLHSEDKEEQLRFAAYWITKGLEAYELLLEQCPQGPFSLGAQVTLADLCLVPQCYNAERFAIPIPRRVERIYHNCLATEACKTSAPDLYAP